MKKFHFFFAVLILGLSLNFSHAEPLLRGKSYPQKHFSTRAKCKQCSPKKKERKLTDEERKEQVKEAREQQAQIIQKNTENVQRLQEIRQTEQRTKP